MGAARCLGLVSHFFRHFIRFGTRGLKGYEKISSVISWLAHAPANLASFDFQEAVVIRLGCSGTPPVYPEAVGLSIPSAYVDAMLP